MPASVDSKAFTYFLVLDFKNWLHKITAFLASVGVLMLSNEKSLVLIVKVFINVRGGLVFPLQMNLKDACVLDGVSYKEGAGHWSSVALKITFYSLNSITALTTEMMLIWEISKNVVLLVWL